MDEGGYQAPVGFICLDMCFGFGDHGGSSLLRTVELNGETQGLQEAENAGREAMERGAYEEAVQCISAALTSPGVQDSSLQLHCLLLLVKCRTECGQHRQVGYCPCLAQLGSNSSSWIVGELLHRSRPEAALQSPFQHR